MGQNKTKKSKREQSDLDIINAVGDDFTPNVREKKQYDALEKIGLTRRRHGDKSGSRNTAQHPGSPHGVERAIEARRRGGAIGFAAMPPKAKKEKKNLSELRK